MLKKLDKLVVKSFVGPFVVTFGIAMFALMMQVLWQYLDDIAGKGLGFFTVIELLAYKLVGLVPLALPLALLISSVMVLGGLAERYELSSFKSAGVSLLRVMRLPIVFGCVAAAVSFACADYLIPVANLQFGARMYDIKQKKPTMAMEPGVFNEDFSQYTIRIGERAANGRDIKDVLIYDHSKAATGELGQIIAKRGEMYSSADGNYFVMKLFDGTQYAEQRPGGQGGSRPFLRTNFATYTKVFDLSEFQLTETSKSLFKTNRSMLATWQLATAIDSIDADVLVRKQGTSNNLTNYLPLYRRDTTIYRDSQIERERKLREMTAARQKKDSIAAIAEAQERAAETRRRKASLGVLDADAGAKPVVMAASTPQPPKDSFEETILLADRLAESRAKALRHPLVTAVNNWGGVDALLDSVSFSVQSRIWNRTRSATRSIKSQSAAAIRVMPGIQESRVKHVYDMHMKYSMALVCILFIFVGAPMGAIVRKGGFGYPILVSIIFFIVFIILTILCRKLAESFVVDAAVAGWLPCVILLPVSLYVTRQAMRDAKLVSFDRVKGMLGRLTARKNAA